TCAVTRSPSRSRTADASCCASSALPERHVCRASAHARDGRARILADHRLAQRLRARDARELLHRAAGADDAERAVAAQPASARQRSKERNGWSEANRTLCAPRVFMKWISSGGRYFGA